MILTIDTDKESPLRLKQIAQFLESLCEKQGPSDSFAPVQEAFSLFDAPVTESSKPFLSSDTPQPSSEKKSFSDDFRIIPY